MTQISSQNPKPISTYESNHTHYQVQTDSPVQALCMATIYQIQSCYGSLVQGYNYNPNPIAANETAEAWGDPHMEGADGDKFDVMGVPGGIYNLFTDSEVMLNGKFEAIGNNGATVIGETGLTLGSGNQKSYITVSTRPKGQVTLNGVVLAPGSEQTLPDGSTIKVSKDGKTVTIHTPEYTLTQKIVKEGSDGELRVTIKSGAQGVNADGIMPSGLLGETFDADKIAKTSTDKNGAGALNHPLNYYEVPSGLFGKAEVVKMLDQEREQDRLFQLMMTALASGNVTMAMMIYAHLETKTANQLTKTLVGKLQSLQAQKKELISKIQNAPNGEEGTKQIQALNQEVGTVNDDITMLQSFMKEVVQNKNQAVEFASNFTSAEHQTTMSVIRSMRG